MAGLGGNVLTLLDWAKRKDPKGNIPIIAELLAQRNEMLLDMQWQEGNLPTGHRTTQRTGLPTAYWRLLNQGIQPSKSTTVQIEDSVGMLEAWSEVDKDLAMLNGNTAEFRLSEATPFIEAMNQQFASTVFYGNSSINPEQFNGLSPRYSTLTATTPISQNVISALGSGSDNTSLWLIAWGPETIHGIFPNGSKAGLVHEDLGEETVEVTAGIAGNRMRAFRDRYQWKGGIVVKDWRYAIRICNIDVSNLVAKSSAADLVDLMIRAYHRIPFIRMGSPAWYMNRTVFEMLNIQRRDSVQLGGQLNYNVVDGVLQPSCMGIPCRIVDQLTLTEAVVS